MVTGNLFHFGMVRNTVLSYRGEELQQALKHCKLSWLADLIARWMPTLSGGMAIRSFRILYFGVKNPVFKKIYKRPYFTNKPDLVTNCELLAGLGDHEAVSIKNSLFIKKKEQTKRKILLWNRADVNKIKEKIHTFRKSCTHRKFHQSQNRRSRRYSFRHHPFV